MLAYVRVAGGQIELFEPWGKPAIGPLPYDEPLNEVRSLEDVVANLHRMAAAQRLRELKSEPSDGLPAGSVEVSWGRVESGKPVPLGLAGETLVVGQSIYVKVRNKHHDKKPVTQLVQRAQVGGTRDLSGDAESEGFLIQQIEFQLSPHPLVEWGNEGFLIDDRPPASSLLSAPPGQGVVSAQGAGATRSFLVAGSPEGGVASWAPRRARRGAGPLVRLPRRLALRISELIVHDVHTLFGGADVRVDALVITRQVRAGAPAAGATPGHDQPFLTDTRRFPNVRDGERLPFDDVLIYEGDVRDFVDLRVWVSRDRDDAKPLAEMLRQATNSDEFKEAAKTIVAMTAAAPQAAAIIAAVGASTTVGGIAARLLSQALPMTLGIYQTSLLASEGFRVGRHPAQGQHRARDISFSYEVVAVG